MYPILPQFQQLVCLSAVLLGSRSVPASAQIIPSAVQGNRLAVWGAIGARQEWSPRVNTTVYLGGDSQSDLDNFNATKKLGILAANQETYYEASKHWRFAFCTNVRLQGNYAQTAPYELVPQGVRREVRPYLRLIYQHDLSRVVRFQYILRPEYRFYFRKDGGRYSPDESFRSRYLFQVQFKLEPTGHHLLFLGNEVLASTTRTHNADGERVWSRYQYMDFRNFVSYRYAFPNERLYAELAVMNQFWLDARRRNHYATYLGANLIFQNPVGRLGN